MDKPRIVPLRLRRQIRVTAAVSIGPWLATIFLYWPQFQLHPAMLLGLLPGLAVALRIIEQLSRHLASNHRIGEEFPIFNTLGAANWITLLRAGAVVGLAGILPSAIRHGPALPETLRWAPGIIYLGISIADLVDGYVARRQRRETVLGKRLDIESDAAGLLVASLVAVALGRLPAAYLLVGLAYYPFNLGIWIRKKRTLPVIALQPRPYARITAGFQMGLVTVALLPIFNPPLLSAASLIFMVPLLIGFLRDWLVVSGKVKTDADQQTALDRWASSSMLKTMPWVLRLAILACGIATLVNDGVSQTHPLWQLAHSLCCLLAGLGCMGRSAALGLTLILGSIWSPFGLSAISMVIFGTSATLMLTGTGAMSLWTPEEKVLYRR
ncbi:MAG: CDP-alcohol phosphatidyltransferase family protein [Desulfobacterales bacterium]|nr:CDP-alcohol phosphatidyltransferase family protein [Desulfobacterales bacterium]